MFYMLGFRLPERKPPTVVPQWRDYGRQAKGTTKAKRDLPKAQEKFNQEETETRHSNGAYQRAAEGILLT